MKIDWQQLALNIRQVTPLTPLSLKLGFNHSCLGQLSRGEIKEPRFSAGIALLNCHLDLCGEVKHRALVLS